MPIDRMTQLEQALTAAREMIADLQRRNELAEQAWATRDAQQRQRITWLEGRLVIETVGVSKQRIS